MREERRIPYKKFNEIYKLVPRLGVELIAIDKRGVLWTRRTIRPYKGMWHLPGGSVFLHETLEQAIRRISQTELGTDVFVLRQLGIIEYPHEATDRHTVTIIFLVTLKGPVKLNTEADKHCFSFYPPDGSIKEYEQFFRTANLNIL